MEIEIEGYYDAWDMDEGGRKVVVLRLSDQEVVDHLALIMPWMDQQEAIIDLDNAKLLHASIGEWIEKHPKK